MKVLKIEENMGEKKGKLVHLLPDSGVIPKARKGQFAAIVVQNGMDGMLTATVDRESSTEMQLTIPDNGEMANMKLLNMVNLNMMLKVGMPCGE